MAAAPSSAVVASLAGTAARAGGCTLTPRPHRVGAPLTGAGPAAAAGRECGDRLAAGAGGRAGRKLNGVRCQAIPFFTKLQQAASKVAGGGEKVEDLVGSVQVLKEGAFDVASHILAELMSQKVKLFLVSTELDPEIA